MDNERYGRLRDLAALLIVAIACPVAVFGGSNLGCVGSAGFGGGCALTMIFVSPLILLLGGVLAGLVTRGWTGLMLVLVGTVVGMFAILVLAGLAGKTVPVDLFSGIVASVFFGGPVVIGYAIGRVASRLYATRAS